MHSTKLRQVGGSVMLAVPPVLLNALHLSEGSIVGMRIEDRRLVVYPNPRKRYTLDKLLAQCDASQPTYAEDHEWLNSSPRGVR